MWDCVLGRGAVARTVNCHMDVCSVLDSCCCCLCCEWDESWSKSKCERKREGDVCLRSPICVKIARRLVPHMKTNRKTHEQNKHTKNAVVQFCFHFSFLNSTVDHDLLMWRSLWLSTRTSAQVLSFSNIFARVLRFSPEIRLTYCPVEQSTEKKKKKRRKNWIKIACATLCVSDMCDFETLGADKDRKKENWR